MHSSTFSCSLPSEGSNFVTATPIRGTLQILWTCISVLILCTWSVIHPNVPPPIGSKHRNEERTRKAWLRHTFKAFERSQLKARLMILNIIVPELVLITALSDFLSARRLKSKFAAQAQEDDVPWSNVHTHFANMGGFAISFADLVMPHVAVESGLTKINVIGEPVENSNTLGINRKLLNALDSPAWARRAAKFLTPVDAETASKCVNNILSVSKSLEQGWEIDPWNSRLIAEALDSPDLLDLGGRRAIDEMRIYVGALLLRANLWIPDAPQLLLLRQLQIIDSLPNVDPEDLDDRSKSNLFIKLIAIGQICWFILEFFVRLSIRLAITQLEVMVFAFTVVSIAAHVLTWHRPKDVAYTLRLKATNYPTCSADIVKIAKQSPDSFSPMNSRNTLWFPNDLRNRRPTGSDYGFLAEYIAPPVFSIFGAFHCIAWHSVFPSEIEQILWRTSSIITTVLPYFRLFNHSIVSPASFLVFVLARLYLLVEVFRSLALQPPDAYRATWVSNVPHI